MQNDLKDNNIMYSTIGQSLREEWTTKRVIQLKQFGLSTNIATRDIKIGVGVHYCLSVVYFQLRVSSINLKNLLLSSLTTHQTLSFSFWSCTCYFSLTVLGYSLNRILSSQLTALTLNPLEYPLTHLSTKLSASPNKTVGLHWSNQSYHYHHYSLAGSSR